MLVENSSFFFSSNNINNNVDDLDVILNGSICIEQEMLRVRLDLQ